MRKSFASLCLILGCLNYAQATECPPLEPIPNQRYLVAISDLHFGVGKVGNAWHPTEDFRWSKALAGFLERISSCGKGAVDLVIAGDSMELWQPPKEIKCEGRNADSGCTADEYLRLTKIVVNAHQDDFAALGRFSDQGSNRVFFVPGNHDAPLLLEDIWSEVKTALASKAGRVFRCGPNSVSPCTQTGLWVSEDGQVVIEHGHQIGSDVNKFSRWPDILVSVDGSQYIERPWGQWFVQSLFNAEEISYPIIDNLSPEASGARFRMADRGVWKSIADVARFLKFNLIETSLSQKKGALGAPGEAPQWNIGSARRIGYKLFANALPKDDPFRVQLEGNTKEAEALRAELNRLLLDEKQMPDEEVKLMCDQMDIRNQGRCDSTLGAALQKALISKHDVLASHLRSRLQDESFKRMRLFIYGHTHELEEQWPVDARGSKNILVYNTGAFQRTIHEDGFLSRINSKKLDPTDALRSLRIEDMASCYTAVVVPMGRQSLEGRTVRWLMDEDKVGMFVRPDDERCK